MVNIEEYNINKSDKLSPLDRQVLDVYGQLYGIHNNRNDEIRAQLRNDFQESHCYVLTTEDEVTGVANYQSYPDKGTSYLFGLAIDETRRGVGFGALVIDYLTEKTREDGNDRFSLDALDSAIGFYAKLGFVITDDSDPSTPIMEKLVVPY